ncbi:MAG: choice-of-anchor D domain-containing protein [Acidobacteriales bacterium]|nr:choice-of-anchor D domain-containing protein [Terriglobales bacterium]
MAKAPAAQAAASGQLTISPSTMDFGSLAVGASATQKATLTAGNYAVTISTVDQSGQGYSLSGITFPVTIAAGHSLSFTVTFAPQSAGSAAGTLSFLSDASNSPATESVRGAGTQSTAESVSLNWEPSTSPVRGYNVYRSTVSGGPYSRLNSSPQPATSYVDATVTSGTYYYVATSVDSHSVESSFSNQATAQVP